MAMRSMELVGRLFVFLCYLFDMYAPVSLQRSNVRSCLQSTARNHAPRVLSMHTRRDSVSC